MEGWIPLLYTLSVDKLALFQYRRTVNTTSAASQFQMQHGYGFYSLGRPISLLIETEFSDRLYSFTFVLNNERLPPGQIHSRATGIYNQSAQLNLDCIVELSGNWHHHTSVYTRLHYLVIK